ncbi:hypothetical protein P691DRAFT_792945 [Macrolepiota fuliginosa MF-IS2]|uniref:Uncharacterized protein n=1 Tax=Macrolepiota fuliginosa MF-IS2 TaxID=1400762 RepID=A0A9P5WX92_9AGAR|nr:hypothetical protein P691DRAFT_792945 [Macrolepiota fuliginosa MF-IS2]
MPEYQECLAHYFSMNMFLEAHKDKETTNLGVLALWTDATGKESDLAPDAHVFRLDDSVRLERGTRGHQIALFLVHLVNTEAHPNLSLPSFQSLTWKGVATTGRAGILDFGRLALKLSYLTHTSVQIYTCSQWEMSIQVVNSHVWFHVALAIEFKEYFLTFVTNDNVFQPEWGPSFEKMKDDSPPDIEDNKMWKSTGLACEVIWDKGQAVFSGVGVYTISELFFIAGKVFHSPSQTAHLCEAFWQYAYTTWMKTL